MIAIIAGVIIAPDKPLSTNSSVARIAALVGSHPQQEALGGTLSVLGAVLFLGYAAPIAHRLRLSNRSAPLAFWLLGAAGAFAIFATLDVVVINALDFASRQGSLTGEPELTRMMYHLYNGLLMPGAAHVALAAYFAIFAIAARTRILTPQWLAWPCAVLAPIAAVNGIVGLASPTGGTFPLAPLAVLGFVVVNVISSVSVLRERPASLDRSRLVRAAA